MTSWMRRVLGLTVGAVGFLTLSAEVNPDELDCEQAVAHLAECCPDVRPSMFFCQHVSGCGSSQAPDFTADDSQCILALDCNGVQAQGLCKKVQHLAPMGTHAGGCLDTNASCQPSTDTGHPRVCR
jgi:hypothetical protein